VSVYTVHQPPERSADPLPEAERFLFVRDGFSFSAFLVAPLWMLWHRMWLVLGGYAIVVAALGLPMAAVGASPTAIAVVALFLSLLVGLEASTLRRLSLRRRGWTNVGIVSGEDLEDAERRFFDAWLRASASRRTAASAATPASLTATPVPRVPQAPAVIGLFPEPGAQR
jgi:hypothetical protein